MKWRWTAACVTWQSAHEMFLKIDIYEGRLSSMKYHMNTMILKMSMNLRLSYVYCAGIIAILSSLEEDDMLNDLTPELLWYLLGEELDCGFDALLDAYHSMSAPKKKRIKKTTSKSFTPPTLDEVRGYCVERKNEVDPEKWYNYYASKGWKVGREQMVDWQAAIRTWEKNNFSSTSPKTNPKNPAIDYAQREYKDEDFGSDFFVDLSKYGE